MDLKEQYQVIMKNEKKASEKKAAIEQKYTMAKEHALANLDRKYSPLINAATDDYNKTIEDKKKFFAMVSRYAIFNIWWLRDSIVEIIAALEGKLMNSEVVYVTDLAHFQNLRYLILYDDVAKTSIDKENKTIKKEELDALLHDGLALVLDETAFYELNYGTVSKVLYNASNPNLKLQNVNLGTFSYLEEFLEKVVDYRIQKGNVEFSLEELNNLKEEFIFSKLNSLARTRV